MLTVIALGGNALLERNDRPDAAIQRHHIQRAATALAPLAAEGQLLLCHGNGPQIGLLALESQDDPTLTKAYPLDALGAQTQGMIGYWLAQELHNAGVSRSIVAVVTQTVVDKADPAFSSPSKFIGRGHTRSDAEQLASRHGWQILADGPDWRRVVPSPQPLGILEQDSVQRLLEAGTVVICAGGGGAPVTRDEDGHLSGVEAVVDKDYTSARIALDLAADRLLLLTDVRAVMRGFGTPDARPIEHISVDQLADLDLPQGSMGPKVEACARFTTATGRPSAIGALTDAAAILRGDAGTTITSSRHLDVGVRQADDTDPAPSSNRQGRKP